MRNSAPPVVVAVRAMGDAMGYSREREETVHLLALEGWTIADIRELFRLAQGAQSYAIAMCNRQVSEREEKAAERRKVRIKALCAKNGCAATVSGDPRGYVVKVKLKSGKSNHWGGETWGIATR